VTVTVTPQELLDADIFAEATVRQLRALVPALDTLNSARKELAAAEFRRDQALRDIAAAEGKINAALVEAGTPGAQLLSAIATSLNLTRPE
jgi:hypothetical protein